MADIRIKDLPPEAVPVSSEKLAIDGSSTRSATIAAIVEVGRPTASQAEAEAGTQPYNAMTPLTTAQAIAALGATHAQGAKADTALQPADIGVSIARASANSLTSAATMNLASVDVITVNRFSDSSPFAPGYYSKVAQPGNVEPPHAAKFQDTSGEWFELNGNQPITVEMFGAKGDLTFSLTGVGYERTAGTNDLAAWQAAQTFVIAKGKRRIYINGNYYLNGQFTFEPGVEFVSEMDFANFVWFHYGRLECGFRYFDGDGGCFKRVSVIGQYDPDTPKPANNGQLGTIGTLGDFYTPDAQTKCSNFEIELLACRAADTVSQNSVTSIMFFLMGYTENAKVKVGLHGKSNVPSLSVVSQHWGCKYDPSSIPPGTEDKVDAVIQETYHPLYNDVQWLTDLNATDHGLTSAWTLSASGGSTVGPTRGFGFPSPYYILPGDVTDYYAISEQKAAVGKAIRIGFQHFTESAPADADADLCLILSRGTSKFEDYAGTAIKIIRQLEFDIKFEGHRIEAISGTDVSGIRCFGILGNVDLGDCWIYGCGKAAIENEYSVSNVTYRLMGSDGLLRHEYVRGGSILGSNTSRGDAANSGESGDDKSGYASSNSAIYIVGNEFATTTTATIAQYATTIPIAALSSDVCIGMKINVGGQEVEARAFIDNGVPFLITSPLPQAIASFPVVVTVNQLAVVDKLVGNYESSEYGLYVSGGNIKDADLTEVGFTGRYAARLAGNSIMRLRGEMPKGVGLITPGSNYTIRVEPGSHLILDGMRIDDVTSRVAQHLQLQRTGSTGPWGTATLLGCSVENVATLATSTLLREVIHMFGCVDYNGAPLIVPGATGNNANGYWTFNEDGTLDCRLRNVSTDASGNYTWTFPQAFLAAASTVVEVTPTSTANPFFAQGISSTTTTATIKTFNLAGTGATAGVNLFAKGYWR